MEKLEIGDGTWRASRVLLRALLAAPRDGDGRVVLGDLVQVLELKGRARMPMVSVHVVLLVWLFAVVLWWCNGVLVSWWMLLTAVGGEYCC